MNSRNHSLLVDQAIVLVLALIAIVGYKYSPLLLPTADLSLAPAALLQLIVNVLVKGLTTP